MLYLDKLEMIGSAISHPITYGEITSILYEQMYTEIDNSKHTLVQIVREACRYSRQSNCSLMVTWRSREDVMGMTRADETSYTVKDVSSIVINPHENFDDVIKAIYLSQHDELPQEFHEY